MVAASPLRCCGEAAPLLAPRWEDCLSLRHRNADLPIDFLPQEEVYLQEGAAVRAVHSLEEVECVVNEGHQLILERIKCWIAGHYCVLINNVEADLWRVGGPPLPPRSLTSSQPDNGETRWISQGRSVAQSGYNEPQHEQVVPAQRSMFQD